jgi:hypothetical protein
MHSYDFVNKSISENNVKSIINKAGYNTGDYTYTPRLSGDGYVVRGNEVMNINKLERAAKELNIKVEIYSPNLARTAGTFSTRFLAAAGTPYAVTITMSPATVQTLLGSDYILYGFKAVQSTVGGGAPVVWFQTNNFSASTQVSWVEDYQAYTSTSTIIPNGEIVASFNTDITLGQKLEVQQGGVGDVVSSTLPLAISILNTIGTPFTCGISQQVNGTSSPMCAFPLYGNNLDVIVPLELVLLMFATNPVNTGTVIEQSYGPGILIDLTANNQRSVNYDINLGWTWGGYSWGQSVQASSNLLPLLIT